MCVMTMAAGGYNMRSFEYKQFSERGKGGMLAEYLCENRNDENGNPAGGSVRGMGLMIDWQDGPLGRGADRKEPNGAFVETVIDAARQRIAYYQESKFRCRENAIALTKLEEALMWLNKRTADREKKGIEGTHQADNLVQNVAALDAEMKGNCAPYKLTDETMAAAMDATADIRTAIRNAAESAVEDGPTAACEQASISEVAAPAIATDAAAPVVAGNDIPQEPGNPVGVAEEIPTESFSHGERQIDEVIEE